MADKFGFVGGWICNFDWCYYGACFGVSNVRIKYCWKYVDEEISIGDYVLTGGEIPAMCLVDGVSRYVEGVLSKESIVEESFSTDTLLEYPQYTKPYEFEGMKVPEILISGNHQKIDEWRQDQRLITTYNKRKDLLDETQRNLAKKIIKKYKD